VLPCRQQQAPWVHCIMGVICAPIPNTLVPLVPRCVGLADLSVMRTHCSSDSYSYHSTVGVALMDRTQTSPPPSPPTHGHPHVRLRQHLAHTLQSLAAACIPSSRPPQPSLPPSPCLDLECRRLPLQCSNQPSAAAWSSRACLKTSSASQTNS